MAGLGEFVRGGQRCHRGLLFLNKHYKKKVSLLMSMKKVIYLNFLGLANNLSVRKFRKYRK